ncbi:hypothetical protein LCGC14_2731470, partial [marine sediment metagenome]
EECKQCSSVFAFLAEANAADSPLPNLDAGDKRSIIGGVETLIAYETKYHSVDNLVPLSDDHIEVGFAVSLGESLCGGFEILFCGRIDAICRDKQGLFIADHKTTWSLAQMWQWGLNPNHQFTGYAYGASLTLGEPIHRVMVNGIQVSGKSRNFSRPQLERTILSYENWKKMVLHRVEQMRRAVEVGYYDPAMGVSCTRYNSKCAYYDVCLAPGMEEVMMEDFEIQEWAPYGEPMLGAFKEMMK